MAATIQHKNPIKVSTLNKRLAKQIQHCYVGMPHDTPERLAGVAGEVYEAMTRRKIGPLGWALWNDVFGETAGLRGVRIWLVEYRSNLYWVETPEVHDKYKHLATATYRDLPQVFIS